MRPAELISTLLNSDWSKISEFKKNLNCEVNGNHGKVEKILIFAQKKSRKVKNMDMDWKEELERKPVVAPTEAAKNIIQLSDSDEEDSFEYKKNPVMKPELVAAAPAVASHQPLIDGFEHVSNPIGDFINNTSEKINSRYDDLLSGLGEVKNNLSSNVDNKIDTTLDFLSSERGDRTSQVEVVAAPPLIPSVPHIPVAEPQAPKKAPEPEEESKNNYDYFQDDSPAVSAHTSPAKKSTIITDLDDKFISSEDLLSDFQKPKAEELPAKASVLPSVQKKLEEKFSGVLDDLSSIATSGVESLNASLPKVAVTTDPVAVPDIKIVSVQKLFAEYGLGELLF